MSPSLRASRVPVGGRRVGREMLHRVARPWAVCEPRPPERRGADGYENEGAERLSRASIAIGADAWWSASLTVPRDNEAGAAPTVFLRIERQGAPPAGYEGDVSVHFSLPASEAAPVAALIAGLIEQARRDGTLSPPGGAAHS